MMRKHINSLDFTAKGGHKLPFYCWECLTLQLPLGDIELVIPDENQMKIMIQFLILRLKSVDGLKNTADEKIKQLMASQFQGEQNQLRLYETKDYELKNLYRLNSQILSEKTWQKF